MKRNFTISIAVAVLMAAACTSNAWHISGKVLCHSEQGDVPLANVVVVTENTAGTYSAFVVTDQLGRYFQALPDKPDSYVTSVRTDTLPFSVNSPVPLIPLAGEYAYTFTDSWFIFETADWLFPCGGVCWLTGGGVKFEPILDARVAEGGPSDSLGGNVYPGCSPTAGDGGQWNHVAHSLKLHFQGTAIQVVHCGNVDGIEPGSESPKTPFNFIEFVGTGRVKGIKGNKVDYPTVYFFARCEDHNEPGSKGAKDGVLVDTYYLHVYTDLADPIGSTIMLFGETTDPSVVAPRLITGGNLQIHISSCDNPPLD